MSSSCVRALSSLAIALLAASANAEELTGTVVSVEDGDTLTVLVETQRIEVHLADIDAPELKQPFGQQSRESLVELCFGTDAVVREIRRDGYGRTLGRLDCAGADANVEQLRRGMAWVYQRQPDTASSLFFFQDQAQRIREGLWVDKTPVAPWEWRRLRRPIPKPKKK
ncbi:MAG: thermonuclease family protein [Betaproteobacteria bacterium]|nr:thermonuclease family protein [Betaproteobacteria bacterium]